METKITMTKSEREALSYLPPRLYSAAQSLWGIRRVINEVRLRRNACLAVTSHGENFYSDTFVTYDDLREIFRSLCSNSLYSHSETIREGYICTPGGLRCGVCGRAVIEDGRVISVVDVSAVSVRIPHRVPGAANQALDVLRRLDRHSGMLVYSPPGVGKTTVLREMIYSLATGSAAKRVAVIDTRYELCAGIAEGTSADCLYGYPRAVGMEIAMRTLSPEIIFCDEITNEADCEAITECTFCGVPVIATAHASSKAQLMSRPVIKHLLDCGAVGALIGLKRTSSGVSYDVSYINDSEHSRSFGAAAVIRS